MTENFAQLFEESLKTVELDVSALEPALPVCMMGALGDAVGVAVSMVPLSFVLCGACHCAGSVVGSALQPADFRARNAGDSATGLWKWGRLVGAAHTISGVRGGYKPLPVVFAEFARPLFVRQKRRAFPMCGTVRGMRHHRFFRHANPRAGAPCNGFLSARPRRCWIGPRGRFNRVGASAA